MSFLSKKTVASLAILLLCSLATIQVNAQNAMDERFNDGTDMPKPSSDTSGIEPVIQTIEADGTHRYFDMLGRPLNHKPEQGIYIDNDKKVIAK